MFLHRASLFEKSGPSWVGRQWRSIIGGAESPAGPSHDAHLPTAGRSDGASIAVIRYETLSIQTSSA
jgi:hypothetical protein